MFKTKIALKNMLKNTLFSFKEKFLTFENKAPETSSERPDRRRDIETEQFTVASVEKEAANAEATAVAKEATNDILASNSTLEQVLKSGHISVSPDGKRVLWTFSVIDENGKIVESERSFRNTKRFQKALMAKDKSGNLVNNNTAKAKLLVYSHLLKVITKKDGSIKRNIHKVAAYEKSNEFLKEQIAKLTEEVKQAPKSQIIGGPRQEAPPQGEAAPDASAQKVTYKADAIVRDTLDVKFPGDRKWTSIKVNADPEITITRSPHLDTEGETQFTIDANGSTVGYFKFDNATKTLVTRTSDLAESRAAQTGIKYDVYLEGNTLVVKKNIQSLANSAAEASDKQNEVPEAAKNFTDKKLSYITKLKADGNWYSAETVENQKAIPEVEGGRRTNAEVANIEYSVQDGKILRRETQNEPGGRGIVKVTFGRDSENSRWIATEKDYEEDSFKEYLKSNATDENLVKKVHDRYDEALVKVTIDGLTVDKAIEFAQAKGIETDPTLASYLVKLANDGKWYAAKDVVKDATDVPAWLTEVINGTGTYSNPFYMKKDGELFAKATITENGVVKGEIISKKVPKSEKWKEVSFNFDKSAKEEIFTEVTTGNLPDESAVEIFVKGKLNRVDTTNVTIDSIPVAEFIKQAKAVFNSKDKAVKVEVPVAKREPVVDVPKPAEAQKPVESTYPIGYPDGFYVIPEDGEWVPAINYVTNKVPATEIEKYQKFNAQLAIIDNKLTIRVETNDRFIYQEFVGGKWVETHHQFKSGMAQAEPAPVAPAPTPAPSPEKSAESAKEFYSNPDLPYLTGLEMDGKWHEAKDAVDMTKLENGTLKKTLEGEYTSYRDMRFKYENNDLQRRYIDLASSRKFSEKYTGIKEKPWIEIGAALVTEAEFKENIHHIGKHNETKEDILGDLEEIFGDQSKGETMIFGMTFDQAVKEAYAEFDRVKGVQPAPVAAPTPAVPVQPTAAPVAAPVPTAEAPVAPAPAAEPAPTADEAAAQRAMLENARLAEISAANRAFNVIDTKITTQTVDHNIGSLSEEEMTAQWATFDGHKPVDTILTKAPFNVLPNQTGRIAAAIISEGLNSKVDLEDIQTVMEKNGNKVDKAAATELLYYISKIRFPENGNVAREMSEEEILHAGLAAGQEKELDGLKNVFNYTEKPAGWGWEKMMNFFAGGARAHEITMSRVDGSTFAMDEGMFRRHFNPQAALLGFLNKPGLYSMDSNGKKVLDKAKVVEEINKVMKLGFAQLILKDNLAGKNATGAKYQEATYKINSIDDLAKLNEDQMMVFQTGFVLEKARQFEQSVKEAKDIITEDTPEGIKAILEQFKDKVPTRQLAAIKSTLLGFGYMHVHNGELVGGGVGTNIDIGDGHTLTIGLGGSDKIPGQVTGMVGANFQVYKDGKNIISIPVGISPMGVGVGVAGKHDVGGGIDVGWNAGVGFTWADLLGGNGTGLQAGVSLSWERAANNAQLKNNTEEAKQNSGLKEIWDTWQTTPDNKKLDLIKSSSLWPKVKQAMDSHPEAMTEDMVIKAVDLYIEEVKQKQIYDEMMAVGPVGINLNLGVGIAGALTGGLGFLAGMEFQIGSVTVFVPHPKEEARILSEISNMRVEDKVKKQYEAQVKQVFGDLEKGKAEVAFTEATPNIYYRPGVGLGIRTESKEVSFDGLQAKTTETGTGVPFDKYNEALKEAEIRLRQSGNGAELVVDNDDDKDIEIHIDPTLHELALVKENGHVALRGDIGDLIISRERFEFNRPLNEGQTSVRDVITIRQNKSMLGKRDRMWIEAHEGKYLGKVMGQKEYQIMTGNNPEGLQSNLVDNTKEDRSGDTAKRLAYHDKFKDGTEGRMKEVGYGLNEERINKLEAEATEMQKILGAKTEEEYNSERTMDEAALYSALDTVYKSAGFKAQLDKIEVITDSENMMALLQKQPGLESLSDKEYNVAISYMLNRHYSNLNQSPARLNKVKEYTKKKYLSSFVTMKNNLGLESSADDMAEKFVDDIYKGLAEKLQNASVNGLDAGDIFVSGTWGTKNGSRQRAFGRTVNYEQIAKPENLAHEFGFFGDTGKQYDLNSPDQTEKDLARALLEIASPVKTSNEELIKSPLATKILGLKAYRLMVEEPNGGGETQYKAMMEILKNPAAAAQYPAEMNRFRGFVEEVRKNQMDKTPMKIETKDGLTITLDMSNTKVRSGAYTKCGNASHSVNELGSITIERTSGRTVSKPGVIGKMGVQNEISDNELTKRFVKLGLAVGITSSEVEDTETKEEERPKGLDDTPVGATEVPKVPGAGPGQATVGGETHTTPPSPQQQQNH